MRPPDCHESPDQPGGRVAASKLWSWVAASSTVPASVARVPVCAVLAAKSAALASTRHGAATTGEASANMNAKRMNAKRTTAVERDTGSRALVPLENAKRAPDRRAPDRNFQQRQRSTRTS